MEEEQKHTIIGRVSILIPIICVVLIGFVIAIMYISPAQSLFQLILLISIVMLILLIASLVLGAFAFTNKQKDNYGLIGLIASIILIFCIIPMIASSFVYLTISQNENMMVSYIVLKKNTLEKTLVVSAIPSDDLIWSDFSITGDCNTSHLVGSVKIGDTLRNCSGEISIIYEPTRTMVGIWFFE